MGFILGEKKVHEVEKGGNLYFLINALIGAYNRRTDVMHRESETIINTQKEILKKMSELSDAVAAIGNDVGELQAAVQRVLDLLNQPNPDVAAAVAALQAADAGFDAIRDSLNAAGQPAAPPA